MRETATITMSRPVLSQLREIARLEKRTLSQQLELLVERHLGTAKPTKPARAKKAAAK
jgi:hypothetical protein